jgi:hypothetical protein
LHLVDGALLVEAFTAHPEDVRDAAASEAILGHLEDALPEGLGVLLLVDVDVARTSMAWRMPFLP